jgi:hypothetical protein
MLIELDQNTLANMTAALEWVCKKLPAGKDTHEARKQIADAMIDSARRGQRTYPDFEAARQRVLREITRPPHFLERLGKWLASSAK